MLTCEHREQLRASGLSDETIAACGARSFLTPREAERAVGRRSGSFESGGLGFPIYRPFILSCLGVRRRHSWRVRLDVPRKPKGKGRPIKYDQPHGEPSPLYFPPRTLALRRRQPSTLVVWTEGEKKALLLDQLGYCTVGLLGVSNFHDPKAGKRQKALHPWAGKYLRLDDRPHVVVFDADIKTNRDVRLAATRLKRLLEEAGAACVGVVGVPEVEGGGGVDDLFMARGEASVRSLIAGAAK